MGLFKKLREIDANSSRANIYKDRQAAVKAKREEQQAAKTPHPIMPLHKRGEKLLADNLSQDETVLVKLPGQFGQGLVMTNKRLYIVKWGFQAGSTFGGKCIAYEYRNITALEIRKHMTSRFVQILTPATQDRKMSYWAERDKGNNAIESDFTVTYEKKYDEVFQKAVTMARDAISKLHEGNHATTQDDSLAQLEKLAELKQKGVITDEEFATKKKQLLGL